MMKSPGIANRSDLKVVQLYLHGDNEAEKFLYDSLRQMVTKTLQSARPKGIVFSDEENVISEIMYRIMVAEDCKILKKYNGECKLSTYMWQIIRCQIIDAYRKEVSLKRKTELSTDFDNMSEDTPEQINEIELVLEEHFSGLPELERFIKLSKWVDKLSYEQIIDKVKEKFPAENSLNNSRIAYVLFTNRRALKKKLKKYVIR